MVSSMPETGRLGAYHGTTRCLHGIGMFISHLCVSRAGEKARSWRGSPLSSAASFAVCRCAPPTLRPRPSWRCATAGPPLHLATGELGCQPLRVAARLHQVGQHSAPCHHRLNQTGSFSFFLGLWLLDSMRAMPTVATSAARSARPPS